MSRLSFSNLFRQIRRIAPTSRLGRFTLYLASLDLIFYLVDTGLTRLSTRLVEASGLDTWIIVLTGVLVLLAVILFLRWFRYKAMWRLRNRLIVAYVFIGVIPVALVVAMAFAAGYLFAGQFATFLVNSDLHSELNSLAATNLTVAAELANAIRRRDPTPIKTMPAAVGERLDDPRLAKTEIKAWYRGEAVDVHTPAGPKPEPALMLPKWAKRQFQGVVSDKGSLYLRAVEVSQVGNGELAVVSSAPLDQEVVARLAEVTGEITIFPLSLIRLPSNAQGKSEISVDRQHEGSGPTREGEKGRSGGVSSPIQAVIAGRLPPPSNRFDRQVAFVAPLAVTDWNTGEGSPKALQVKTRPSLLYSRLFSRVGEFGRIVEGVLIFIAVSFAFIELLAFLIGVGITRTITRSVAELYNATQRVNRGDLKHRIEVKSRDQLAELEASFNSMTESLERLLNEQKEKQRLQDELTIAQEVQAQLFPKGSSDLATLEVHGVCRPARTVSGDYYDFLPLGHERLGIAVGDISGKGISAALLMATVHSAVRAYEFGRMPLMHERLVAAGSSRHYAVAHLEMSPRVTDGEFSPSTVLASLNRQLYRSTPLEKYATMFVAVYDGASRALTYSNGGHLPPIVIGTDSSIRRLDTPGLAVGLFDDQGYEQKSLELHPGDMLLAFSDGVTEPENEFGEFGEHRLIQIVAENRRLPLARISELVLTAVSDWVGPNEQPDDVTLVLARARKRGV